MAASVKPLFKAISGQGRKNNSDQGVMGFPVVEDPQSTRDPLDYDPTPPSATKALLREELPHMLKHGTDVWETAVGAGHIAKVLTSEGFTVHGNDVVDRFWPGVELKSFMDCTEARAPIQFTNPPYCLINARDGQGEWLWHTFALGGINYTAMLLNADWPAARINGMDRLLEEHPPSVEYLCCWKVDFRGGGSPPQRNSWFVWDTNRAALGGGGWIRKRLYKDAPDVRQAVLL